MSGDDLRSPERNLDLLRAIAVTCVLIAHAGLMVYPGTPDARPQPYMPYGALGRAGVLIFFVHTSYVLMGSLERLRAQGSTGLGLARLFYVRRAFRIYPLAIAVVLAMHFAQIPARPELWSEWYDPGKRILLANLLLIQNLVGAPNLLLPLWSLPIEVQMYLVLPPLAWSLRRSGRAGIIAHWLGAICIGLVMIFGRAWIGRQFDMLLFAPCFAAGAAAYYFSRRTPARLPSWAWLPMLLVLLALFSLIPAFHTPGYIAILNRGREWLLTLLVAAGLVYVQDSAASRVASAAHTVATYSYGIYLLHVPVLAVAVRAWSDTSILLWWVAVMAGVAVTSWAGYHLVELPGIKLGQQLIRSRTGAASHAPAP